MPLDPSGFQIQVKIIDAESGTEFPLWMRSAQQASEIALNHPNLVESAVLDLPIVESVDIELNLGLNGKTSIAIAAPYDLGLALLKSPLFRIGNVYEVQIGYPRLGRFTPWFAAIAAKPALRISPDEGLTATLNGEGGAFSSMRTSSTVTYSGSYRSAMEQIAERHGWTLSLPDTESGSPLDKEREPFSQGGFSDWIFIQQLARFSNCDAFIQPDPEELGKTQLVVSRRSENSQSRPVRTFAMREQVDFNKVFPMFEFESDAVGVWMPRGNTSVVSYDIDPTNRELSSTRADAETSTVAGTNEVGAGSGSTQIEDTKSELAPEERSSNDAGEYNHVSSRDPRGAQDVNQSHRDEAAFRGGLNATLVSFGIPEQFPGDLIGISGVGEFNGKYRIIGLTHRAMPGEWSMTMQALSNSMGERIIAQHLQQTLPQTNQEEAPEPEVGDDALGGGSEVDPEPA